MPSSSNKTFGKECDYKKEVIKIFNQVQDLNSQHAQATPRLKLRNLYDKSIKFGDDDERIFVKCFFEAVLNAFMIYEPNKHVDNVEKFVVDFSIETHFTDRGDDTLTHTYPVISYVFNGFKQFHEHPDKGIRYHLSCVVRDILSKFSEAGEELDDQLCDDLCQAFLKRVRDRVVKIRVVAIESLIHFQDPDPESVPSCPVIEAFVELMSDNTAEVRETAIKSIFVTGRTLKPIKDRTMDSSEAVRKLAFEKLAEKVSIKSLSVADRIELLRRGQIDKAESVRQVCEKKLLKEWLNSCGNQIEALLQRFDLICEDETVISYALYSVFRLTSSLEELVEKFDLLNEKKLIDEITDSKVCYWRHLVSFVDKHAKSEAEHVKLRDRLLPTLLQLAQYVFEYIRDHPFSTEMTTNNIDRSMKTQYISKQLLRLLPYADNCDTAGNNKLREILELLISDRNTNNSLMDLMVEAYLDLHKRSNTKDTAIQFLCESISNLREPEVMQGLEAEEAEVCMAVESLDLTCGSIGGEPEKIADSLESHQRVTYDRTSAFNDDPEILVKCLSIASSLLKLPAVIKLNAVLISLLETLIIPCVKHQEPSLRKLAFECLGMCCVMDRALTKRYIFLFFTTFKLDGEREEVKLPSLQATFDILLVYGMDILTDALADPEKDKADCKNATEKSLQEFVEILEGENMNLQVTAAEGLAKLLLYQRIYAPKILARLILIWFNQVSIGNPKLRHCLGTFFPKFAFSSCKNQEAIEEAFPYTMSTIFGAPTSSPLKKIDCWEVAQFLVHLTRSAKLYPGAGDHEEGTVHGSLALTLCDKIINEPEDDASKVYCRILPELEFDKATEQCLRDLRKLMKSALKVLRQKQPKNFVLKAISKIDEQIKVESDEEEEQEDYEGELSEQGKEEASLELIEQSILPRVTVTSSASSRKSSKGHRRRGKKVLLNTCLDNTTLKTPALTPGRKRLGSADSNMYATPVRRSNRLKLKSEGDLMRIPETENVNSDHGSEEF